nr:NADH-enoyl ACP reductase [Brassica napus, Peptide Partial, 11 aa] [Brassica napus]
TLTADEVGNAA